MIKKWKNLKINLPRKTDLFTFEEVLGRFNQYSLELFMPLLTSDDVIIDLGAHIGLFSLAIAKYVNKVIAIEPAKDNFKILLKNISRNKISNITPINKAIAKEEGKKDFYQSKISPARHSFFVNPFLNGDGFLSELTKVSTTTLSSILSKMDFCKLLKADVEGAEYEVFFNTPIEVLKKIKIFLITYHNISKQYNGKALERFFLKLGFEVIKGSKIAHSSKKTELIEGHLLIINPL